MCKYLYNDIKYKSKTLEKASYCRKLGTNVERKTRRKKYWEKTSASDHLSEILFLAIVVCLCSTTEYVIKWHTEMDFLKCICYCSKIV